jgi:hypothetical protein
MHLTRPPLNKINTRRVGHLFTLNNKQTIKLSTDNKFATQHEMD